MSATLPRIAAALILTLFTAACSKQNSLPQPPAGDTGRPPSVAGSVSINHSGTFEVEREYLYDPRRGFPLETTLRGGCSNETLSGAEKFDARIRVGDEFVREEHKVYANGHFTQYRSVSRTVKNNPDSITFKISLQNNRSGMASMPKNLNGETQCTKGDGRPECRTRYEEWAPKEDELKAARKKVEDCKAADAKSQTNEELSKTYSGKISVGRFKFADGRVVRAIKKDFTIRSRMKCKPANEDQNESEEEVDRGPAVSRVVTIVTTDVVSEIPRVCTRETELFSYQSSEIVGGSYRWATRSEIISAPIRR